MRITPRSLVLATAVFAAAAFTAHTATAETLRVPFDFKVNGKTLPAGAYSVHRNGLTDFISLEGPQTNQSFTWTLGPGDPSPDSNIVKASFVNTGGGYELHRIQYHALTTAKIDKHHASDDSAVHVVRGE
jgi:hypothetical protein